ncbi:hypothetical protein ACFL6S_29670 [Candidatus Poribacteria bacterium]
MKVLSILIVLSLFCLFPGCGGDDEEIIDVPEDKTPDVATITGQVNLVGESDHSGVEVQIYQDESLLNMSETDASGNYSIGLKELDDYTLRFKKDGFVTVVQEIATVEGANPVEAVTLDPGGLISGSVNYDLKAPDDPELKVMVIDEASGQEYVVETDRNGRYEFTVLPGSYMVIIEDTTPEFEFPPFEQEGIEIKVGDAIFVDTLLTTWPYFEAESATDIIGPMEVEEDPAASGGKCLASGGGSAKYEIMIPEDGDYIIWGRALAKDGASDSFFVGVNVDEPSNLWEMPQGSWVWDQVNHRGGADPVIFKISKGMNTVSIKTREAGAKLDRIFLTTSSSARPQ